MAIVFLSHSSRDKELARRIAVDLSMSSVKVWFDEWEIRVGHSISQRVEKGLDDADFVVVILTSHSVQSGWVQKEWRSKIADEASSQGIYILPVVAEDCEIPRLLRDKKYADIRSDYNRGLAELILAISQHTSEKRAVTAGARIESGRIVYERIVPNFPPYHGLINTIESGCFERSGTGLRVHVQIVSSHQDFQNMSEELGLNRLTLESDDYSISTNPAAPTVFTSIRKYVVPVGTKIPNLLTGQNIRLPFALSATTTTRVSGSVDGNVISGTFEQDTNFDQLLAIRTVKITGKFRAVVGV